MDAVSRVHPREFIPGPSLRDQPGWTAQAEAPNGIEEVVVSGDRPDGPDFGFWDFVDLINPLQHIPVVSTIYREVTGDEIKQGSRLFGGALFGGPIGAGAALIDVMVEESTGQNMGEHTMAILFGGDDDDRPPLEPQPTGPLLADAGPRYESPKQPADGEDGSVSDTQAAISRARAATLTGETQTSENVIHAEGRFLPIGQNESTSEVVARARRAIAESLAHMRGQQAEATVPNLVSTALTKYRTLDAATGDDEDPHILDRRY